MLGNIQCVTLLGKIGIGNKLLRKFGVGYILQLVLLHVLGSCIVYWVTAEKQLALSKYCTGSGWHSGQVIRQLLV